jgi:hypothetical protein
MRRIRIPQFQSMRLTVDSTLRMLKLAEAAESPLGLLEVWCFSPIPARSRRRASSPTGSRAPGDSPPASLGLDENHRTSTDPIGRTLHSVSDDFRRYCLSSRE